MNSFRSVARAIESEVARQVALLESGGRVVQETRGWDEAAGATHAMRNKEQAHDYRYFPDPDLSPIEFSPLEVERLRAELGDLPQTRIERYVTADKLSLVQAVQIVDTPGLAAYYDAAVAITGKPQATVNFVLGDLSRLANETGTPVEASALVPERLAEIVLAFDAGLLNSKTAKELLERFWRADELLRTGEGDARLTHPLAEIIAAEGLGQVSDTGFIDGLVSEILAANEKTVADYRAGKTKVLGFLVGQVMKRSRGKANPQLAEERLRAALS
jgi:aspartyl-tRNA(Asn)/glutamyl-tRNA(Gln) amidotransferase subunit B